MLDPSTGLIIADEMKFMSTPVSTVFLVFVIFGGQVKWYCFITPLAMSGGGLRG
jgi:hypothetical protein